MPPLRSPTEPYVTTTRYSQTHPLPLHKRRPMHRQKPLIRRHRSNPPQIPTHTNAQPHPNPTSIRHTLPIRKTPPNTGQNSPRDKRWANATTGHNHIASRITPRNRNSHYLRRDTPTKPPLPACPKSLPARMLRRATPNHPPRPRRHLGECNRQHVQRLRTYPTRANNSSSHKNPHTSDEGR